MTPSALRLLGKIHRRRTPLSMQDMIPHHRPFNSTMTPATAVAELVAHGFLEVVRPWMWQRTPKLYTAKMRHQLAAFAQRASSIDTSKELTTIDPRISAGEAHWFGYPTAPVFMVGRIHLLEQE